MSEIEKIDSQEIIEQPKSYEQIIQEIDALISIEDSETYEQNIKTYIDNRLNILKQTALPRISIGAPGAKPHQGFINADTELRRTHIADGFNLDDDSIYKELIDNIKSLKQSPGWEAISVRQIIPAATNFTIQKYFGGLFGDEAKNREFYFDRTTSDSKPFSVSELKNMGLAVCLERSALAQNLNSFLGLDSQMVSGECQLDPNAKPEFHAYNIIRTEKGDFISDVTNPSAVIDSNNQIVNTQPAFYPLAAEQLTKVVPKN